MYGLGIFISGGVISYRPLIIGGIISWIAALVSYFQPYNVQLLIMTATVIVSYIIPGHMLRIEAKKQKVMSAFRELGSHIAFPAEAFHCFTADGSKICRIHVPGRKDRSHKGKYQCSA